MVAVAGDQEQRRSDAGKPGGAPDRIRAAPGRDRDHRHEARHLQFWLPAATLRIGQQQLAGHPAAGGASRIQRRARDRQHPVATHRIADQRRARRVDKAFTGQRMLQRARHKSDVQRTAQQDLRDFQRIAARRILVTDGGHHVSLGGEILGQPAQRHGRIAASVGDNHQWIATGNRLRAAHRDARHRKGDRRRGRLGLQARLIGFRLRAGCDRGRIPDVDLQWPIAMRRQHVDGLRIHDRHGAHAHRELAEAREFRGIHRRSARGFGGNARRASACRCDSQQQGRASEPHLR